LPNPLLTAGLIGMKTQHITIRFGWQRIVLSSIRPPRAA
jgi:hypothetical protein